MHLMEQEPFSVLPEEGEAVNEEEFEDVTEELFKCVDEDLGELEMLLNPKTFNWEEVMTSFEVMDHKMDLRMKSQPKDGTGCPCAMQILTIASRLRYTSE